MINIEFKNDIIILITQIKFVNKNY